MARIREFNVRSNCAGISLYHFMRRVLPRGYNVDIPKLIRSGNVEVNGESGQAEQVLHVGDYICLKEEALKAAYAKEKADSIEILYQDESVLCVNKPAGLPVIPDRRPGVKTVVQLCRDIFKGQSKYPRPVHRLDKWTSGVLLLALEKNCVEELTNAFAERKIKKTYLALVRGRLFPPDGVVDEPIGPNARRMTRMMVGSRLSKPAITHYRTLDAWQGFSYVEVQPETGRTHQIRVHLSHIGHPIVCDSLYGGGDALYLSEFKLDYRLGRGKKERPLLTRQALHAAKISFTSPGSGKTIRVESPLPQELSVVLKKLDQYGNDT